MQHHVYFDLDGTLTDPFEGISKCILYALDRLNVAHPSHEYLLSCMGPPLYDTFPELVGQERTLQAVDLYRERFNDVGWQENVPYDGIYDALADIANSGCRMFIATSKPRAAAQRIIEYFELGQYFEKVYGCELDGTRSNKVELLRFAVAENPGADTPTMVGDRKHDILGAVANGLRPIGVAYGYGSHDELSSAGARAIATAPFELPGLVKAT